MTPIVAELQALAGRIDAAVLPAVREGAVRQLDDSELVAVMRAAAHLQRQLDAVLIESVGEVGARTQTAVRDERLTSRLGCHDVPELVERVTRVSRQSAAGYRKAARA